MRAIYGGSLAGLGAREHHGQAHHLRALNHNDDQGDGRAEHAAEHRRGGAHRIDARLDVPGGQRLHEQQAARRAERPAHLGCTGTPSPRVAPQQQATAR